MSIQEYIELYFIKYVASLIFSYVKLEFNMKSFFKTNSIISDEIDYFYIRAEYCQNTKYIRIYTQHNINFMQKYNYNDVLELHISKFIEYFEYSRYKNIDYIDPCHIKVLDKISNRFLKYKK